MKANKESVEKALKGKADIDRRPSLTSIVSRHDWEKISAVRILSVSFVLLWYLNRCAQELESLNASTRQSFSELTAAVGRKATKIEANEVRTEVRLVVGCFVSG